jgi:beta-N-acetylhexosaminidase
MSTTGQIALVGIPGHELDSKTAAALKRLQPGGFILFTRNIKSPEGLYKLIEDLRDLSKTEPVITIDQEGGRVSRLKAIGNEPPSASQLRYENNAEMARRHGELTAKLLRLFGFNLNLAPVLEVCLSDEEVTENSLRGRYYGDTPEQVVRLAGAFNNAMRAGGVLNCAKHFPGYTAAVNDAHDDLAEVLRTREQHKEIEFVPYREFIRSGTLDSVMVDHAVYPSLQRIVNTHDSGEKPKPIPATFSKEIIDGILRKEMGFRGMVICDDIDMGAIYHHYPIADTLKFALEAGNDMILICHRVYAEQIDQLHRMMPSLSGTAMDRALESIFNLKERLSPREGDRFDREEFERINAGIWELRVDVLGEERAKERSREDGKRSPVEIY